MTPTTEQRERVARARGWVYVEDIRLGQDHSHWARNGETCLFPDYETVPALNYELEVEAQIGTSPSVLRGQWFALADSMGGMADSSKADNPLTARFLAYLAWMEER